MLFALLRAFTRSETVRPLGRGREVLFPKSELYGEALSGRQVYERLGISRIEDRKGK